MSDTAGDNLSASVERLINKVESLYEWQAVESNRTENMLALLDRLSVILARMEDGKNFEAEISHKIDLLTHSLERSMDFQERLTRGQAGSENTFDRVINGVRLFGLILSALANSIQVTAENIGQVLSRNREGAAFSEGGTGAARTQADLAAVLQPVSTLVKNLVEEKLKQQEPDAGRGREEGAGAQPGEKDPAAQ